MNALPAIYDGHLVHVRRDPMVRVFRHRVHMWFVDLDEPPVLPRWLRPLASFRAADHFGEPGRAIKENVEAWLRTRNVELDGGRVTMLTCARMFGHVFNPLTVYWCHRPDGELRCVIAEVHNTYGERHCYLLWPTSSAIHHVSKQFYVSPFFEVRGNYRMRLPEPAESLSVGVSLLDRGRTVFTATLRGHSRAAAPRTILRLALTVPLMPHRISALIRLHGIALRLRRLPVTPRTGRERERP